MEYPFTVSGGFDVADSHEPVEDAMGSVVSFDLPDGRRVQLVAALEVVTYAGGDPNGDEGGPTSTSPTPRPWRRSASRTSTTAGSSSRPTRSPTPPGLAAPRGYGEVEGLLNEIADGAEGMGEGMIAVCQSRRRGEPRVTVWSSSAPWGQRAQDDRVGDPAQEAVP